MEHRTATSAGQEDGRATVTVSQAAIASPDPIGEIAASLGAAPFAFVSLLISPDADVDRLVTEATERFAPAAVAACTTAGEIGARGYEEGQVLAVAFDARHFSVRAVLIENLDRLDPQAEIERLVRARNAHAAEAPFKLNEFVWVMIDGMSLREDEVMGLVSSGVGGLPTFGGSAGDGTRFGAARLAIGGRTRSNAALVLLIRTNCEVRVFSLDHLVPSDQRMVVTEAVPARRLVRRINAEPAAAEYARVLGKDPNQLDQFTFAAHPVAVRLGGRHHVRAIREVTPEGDLAFFSAVDEGMVLSLAETRHLARHLEQEMRALGAEREPEVVLACDCILRRIEAEQKQMTADMSRIFRENRVAGFSTYGEQIGALHVNHTMTGVAIYPPGARWTSP